MDDHEDGGGAIVRAVSVAPGTRVGPYEIVAPLGTGGMGEVYRARDRKLERDVAIKFLPGSVAQDGERLARFAREARLLASLTHPNIAAIYGFADPSSSSESAAPALVLELVEGETLAARIARGPIPLTDAAAIAAAIADGLAAAHDKGIVHRDLKPANVMLARDGAVKILDFGVAKAAHEGAIADEAVSTILATGTRAGVVLGTAAYMSPEQARGQEVDKRTDIWALGCVLFEMLAGHAAFQRATLTDTVAAVVSGEPEWASLPATVPPRVRELLQRCLARNARDRWRDASDVRLALEDAIAAAGQPAAISPSGAARGSWRLVERALWFAAIVAIGAVAAQGWRRSASSSPQQAIRFFVSPPPGTTFSFSSGAPWPSISPDGRVLAFVAVTDKGEQHLWLQPLDSTTARSLPGTEGAIRPFWAPDSRSIGYFANGRMWRIDLPDGPPRAVTAVSYSGGLKGTWGQDVIVFHSMGGFHRVSPNGGTPTPLLAGLGGDGANALQNLSFLPDGRRYLYSRGERTTSVCVRSVDDPGLDTCVFDAGTPVRYAAPGHVLYVRDGLLRAQPLDLDRLIVSGEPLPVSDRRVRARPAWIAAPYSASANGVLAYHPSTGETVLEWVDRTGQRISAFAPRGEYSDGCISSDGRRFTFWRSDPITDRRDVWLYDSERGTELRVTFDGESASSRLSPDGRDIAWVNHAEGRAALYRKSLAGTTRDELIARSPGGNMVVKDWSVDGDYLLLQVVRPATGWDLFAVRANGKGEPIPAAASEHGEREGKFSPDGALMAYDSTETGQREIWVQPFPPNGRRWQVSTTGGFSPRWRGDGKELFYVAADGRLMSVPVTLTPSFSFGKPAALFDTMFREEAYGSYDVSPDGRRFLMNVAPDGPSTDPITVIVNWTAALRR